ncbi:redoxin domain-containing protein [Undibacterium sp. FT137W]|uniref:Redoxin domain-containing protein n=2 Tax=Undibacterium fentianense TaxID=2828728 RepID=A0A941IE64_9BURK|nr:redoxin domain-containing protein [Undibacterium fentianense]
MIASYFTYYVIKPGAKNNYGAILDARMHPIPDLKLQSSEGGERELSDFKGKWLMLQVDAATCTEVCQRKLLEMRQLRLAQGKEMDRIERIWLITDTATISEQIKPGIAGTQLLRADRAKLDKWLPTEPTTKIEDHIYLIDPLGNLMMRFPKDADPNRVKKDLSKLLKASSIG